MVHQSNGPSSKALGKRPMRNGAAATPSSLSALTPSANSPAADSETDDASLAASMQTRYSNNDRRVQPSRIRRGGGVSSLVGSNDIDRNILDILKRKGENDPLIPARTVFILTTDSSQVPSASTSEIGLNQLANERYFERPEVITAFKAQQDIQVPEFTLLEAEVVGGRLRARSGETECFELTDEAYKKRHRKYEYIERRQRSKEKEQLQYEHYRLKERIEQLRNMDPNAFLALPSDAFGDAERPTDGHLVDGGEPSIGSTASLHEAEHRRKVMLEVALSLEERYRTLLPPRTVEHKLAAQRPSASVEPSMLDENVDGISVTPDRDVGIVEARHKSSRPKSSLRASVQPTPPPTAGTETPRRRKAGHVRGESHPPPSEPEQLEDSFTISAPQSISLRQRRTKTSQMPKTSRPVTPSPSEEALADGVFRISLKGQNRYSQQHAESPSIVNHNGMPPIHVVEEAPSAVRRRRPAMVEADPHLNVIHYVPSPTQVSSPKKKKSSHRRKEPVEQVTEAPELLPDAQLPVSESIPVQDYIESEHPVTPPPSHPDQPSPEVVGVDSAMPSTSIGPAVKLDDRKSYAQLQLLEHPDEDEEVEVEIEAVQQPEVNETPTADEPVTPPVEPHAAEESIIAETHESFVVPDSLEPVPKKRRRTSTPYVLREPSESPPPELPEPTFLPLPVVSMKSYEIPVTSRKGHRPKPIGGLLAESRHNTEPGRKTGRSVKAFGAEVPPFDGEALEFELPRSIIREAIGRRKTDNMSDAASDGDPPSFTDGMAHGEVPLVLPSDSASASGKVGRRRKWT